MSLSLVGSVFVASLLGSVHCAAMCGSFVCACAGITKGKTALFAYNVGRLTSYLALGVLAGVVGYTVDLGGAALGLRKLAVISSGVILVVGGVANLTTALGWRLPLPSSARGAPRLLGRALSRVRQRGSEVQRAAGIGLLSGLLPCGWLYAFVATAVGTGRISHGLVVMTVFWAGTLPTMASLGFGLQRSFGPLRRRLPAITALAMAVLGTYLLASGVRSGGPSAHGVHGFGLNGARVQ